MISIEGDLERAILEILRRHHPKAIDWTLVSRTYLQQVLPELPGEEIDGMAIDMERNGYILFQPFPFLSGRYKPGKMKRCRITPSGEEHLASIEMRARFFGLEEKSADQAYAGESYQRTRARA